MILGHCLRYICTGSSIVNTRSAASEGESASHGQVHMGLPTLIVGHECIKRTVRTDGPHQIADIIILPAYQWIPRLRSEDFGIFRPTQCSYSHIYAEASLNAVPRTFVLVSDRSLQAAAQLLGLGFSRILGCLYQNCICR